jgi:hypothetical protein
MKQDELACKAFIRLTRAIIYKIILVVDDNWKCIGILTPKDFDFKNLRNADYENFRNVDYENIDIGSICNRKFKYLKSSEDKYLYGRNIFSESSNAGVLPILEDKTEIPMGLFARWQAFFLEYFNREGKQQEMLL